MKPQRPERRNRWFADAILVEVFYEREYVWRWSYESKVDYASNDLKSEVVLVIALGFDDVHRICGLKVVYVSFMILVDKKVKRIVSICIISCSVINLLVARSVPDGPFPIILPKIDWKTLA